MATDFKSAFRSARSAGKKVFTWNGKSYNTKLADDSKASATPPKSRVNKPSIPATGDTTSKAPKIRTMTDSPVKLLPDMGAIREGNRASQKVRDAARKARDEAKNAPAKVAPPLSSDQKDKNQSVADKFMNKNRLYAKGGMVKKKGC